MVTIKKKSTKNKCWWGVENREHSYSVGGNVNWYSDAGEEYEVSSKKTKNRATIRSSNPWAYIWRKPKFKKTHAS